MKDIWRGKVLSIHPVVIIGAGISGLMAAKTFKEAGIEPVIIDKGKSVGGRMATRRIGSARLDHGAPTFTATTEEFQTIAEQWVEQGLAKKLTDGSYYGSNGMNAIAKSLETDIPILPETTVTSIDLTGDYFHIPFTGPGNGSLFAHKVLITTPIPQALSLLQTGGVWTSKEVLERIESVQYNRQLVALLTLSEALTQEILDLENNPIIEKVISHHGREVSQENALSLYISLEWTEANWDRSDEEVLTDIIAALPQEMHNHIIEKQLKKWRYSQPTSSIQEPFIRVIPIPALYLAGDFACSQENSNIQGIEKAVLSGIHTAKEMMK